MKIKSLIPILAAGMFFVACSQEQLEPVSQENLTDVQEISKVKSGSLVTSRLILNNTVPLTMLWEQGAINWEAETALPGGVSRTVSAFNNFLGAANQIGFARGTNINAATSDRLGREAGRTITNAFTYKVNAWTATLPFAFGYIYGSPARECIWTPSFKLGSNRLLNIGEFVTDNSALDENKTTGTIEVGDWRAVQMTIVDGTSYRKRVSIEELVNGSWVQRVRPNNNNGIVEMRSFAVLNVRANYSIIGGNVGAPTTKSIPVLKSQLVGINNSISNGATILWTLQKGGQVSYNDELYRF